MGKIIRIGTRESQLAVWQATLVQDLLKKAGFASELIYIKSEGDVDLKTPLYEMGVQGVFTRSLDAALLNDKIDVAVHSMKDVPVQLAKGIKQASILKRGSHKDILVLHPNLSERKTVYRKGFQTITTTGTGKILHEEYWTVPLKEHPDIPGKMEDVVIATSSVRRIAQWLNKYPDHKIENLRGNVNTRLRKLKESNWHGAIFAAAGLERIGLRPENAIDLEWMLPAPAQGAIMVVCRKNDNYSFKACQSFNHEKTALATKIERDFLSALLGGCSTPISALAKVGSKNIDFSGNIVSPDGKQRADVHILYPIAKSSEIGNSAAELILENGGQAIIDSLTNEE